MRGVGLISGVWVWRGLARFSVLGLFRGMILRGVDLVLCFGDLPLGFRFSHGADI